MRPAGPRDPVAGPDAGPESPFPLRLDGKVIKGFGRGSKELGVPTANIPLSGLSVGGHDDVESGVYYGWAGLTPSTATQQHPPGSESKYEHMTTKVMDTLNTAIHGGKKVEAATHRTKGAVYPMVMSIGWNPFYKNKVRSVEVHIMHGFQTDFYGSHMNLVILGFIRPEYDYVDKESLIKDIKEDCEVAGRSLTRPAYAKFKDDPSLLDFDDRSEVAS